MRLLLTLGLLIFTSALARAAEVEFVRVWPDWREAESFERISEYFTGKENPGRRIIRRTKEDDRAGFYFTTRLRNSGAEQPAVKIVLSVIKPDNPQVQTYTFAVPLPHGEPVYDLGLSGTDWAGRKFHPVAWKLEVFATDGTLLAVRKSFLWEKPEK